MLSFQPVKISDIPVLAKYLPYQNYRTSEYSVAGITMWRLFFDKAICVLDDMLYVSMDYQSQTPLYCVPVGPGDMSLALKRLKDHCQAEGQKLTFGAVPEQMRPVLEAEFGKPISITSNRDWYDYLYLTKDLAMLKGKKFKSQRNHISKFKRSYSNYRFAKIDENNLERVREFYREYAPENTPPGAMAAAESQSVIELLNEYFDKFSWLGYLLEVHDEIIGFALGEIVNDTLFVHIEKASLKWHGSYQMLVNGFAQALPTEVKYINREEDIGIEGLRQSKLSYNPIKLLTKYSMQVRI